MWPSVPRRRLIASTNWLQSTIRGIRTCRNVIPISSGLIHPCEEFQSAHIRVSVDPAATLIR